MEHEGGRSVAWLHGEHDIATRDTLAEVIWRWAAEESGDLVLDLSGVELLSAATVGVIVRARDWLRPQSRSLALRAPSVRACRVLDLCGVDCEP